MKTIFRKLWVLIASLWVSLSASAYDFEVDGIYYNVISQEDMTCSVTYKKLVWSEVSDFYTGTIRIPATVTYNNKNFQVTKIDLFAFNFCNELQELILPETIVSIDDRFEYCNSLVSITVHNDNPYYCSIDGILYNKAKTNLLIFPRARSGSFTIPESITTICSGAFEGCSSLTSVTIPNNVIDIDLYAFNGCRSLTSVTLPNSIKHIGDYAFSDCSNLEQINLPDSLYELNSGVFSECTKLSSISIPSYTYRIGENAFKNCKALKEIIIPENIKYLEGNVFDGSGIERCIINDSKDKIDMAFELHNQDASFYGSSIKYLYLGREFNAIKYETVYGFVKRSPFTGLNSLEEIVIGKYVDELPANTFTNNFITGYIPIGGGGGWEFEMHYETLPNLTKLTIKDNPDEYSTELELTTNVWGGGVTEKIANDSIIYDFKNVKTAIIERGNLRWEWESQEKRLDIFKEIENLKLNCHTVSRELLDSCTQLKTLTLGEDVSCIEDNAFRHTNELMDITIAADYPPCVSNGISGFSDKQFTYATVSVPEKSIQRYKEADVWKNFKNIKNINGIPTGIENIEEKSRTVSISAADGSIRVLGKDSNNLIRVFTAQGTKIAETCEDMIPNLSHGVYIVTVGTKSFKVSL